MMNEHITEAETFLINYIINIAYWHDIDVVRLNYKKLQECTNVYCARLNQIVDEPVNDYDYMLSVVRNIQSSGVFIVTPVSNGFTFGLTKQSEEIDLPNRPVREDVREKRRKYEVEHGHVS